MKKENVFKCIDRMENNAKRIKNSASNIDHSVGTNKMVAEKLKGIAEGIEIAINAIKTDILVDEGECNACQY